MRLSASIARRQRCALNRRPHCAPAGAGLDPSRNRSGHPKSTRRQPVSSSTNSMSKTAFRGAVPLSEHPDKLFWTVEGFVAASQDPGHRSPG
jgi:hypothetical protein